MRESNLVFWKTVPLEEAERLCLLDHNQKQKPSVSNPGHRDIYIPQEELDYINLQCSSDI
jgi:hypothetical protein